MVAVFKTVICPTAHKHNTPNDLDLTPVPSSIYYMQYDQYLATHLRALNKNTENKMSMDKLKKFENQRLADQMIMHKEKRNRHKIAEE